MQDGAGLSSVLTNGIPGELLLVFTGLIWAVFALILISNPKNRLNFWCFAGGMLFSVGALKEFLFYTLGPKLVGAGVWTEAFSETLYSLLSGVFYYLSMPTVVVFCLYFHRLDRSHPVWFGRLRLLLYLPAAVLALIYPWGQTLSFQKSPVFCLTVGVYNWLYGLLGTGIVAHALLEERLSVRFRQRRLAAVSILLPLWFWLISAFPYHALGVPNLSKMWQMNLIVVLFVLFYFLYHAFREGIWGMRFRRESYDWSEGNRVLQKNAQYVGHALKNELSKIEWCAQFLGQESNSVREVDILRRSAGRLREFIGRTQLYSDEIILSLESCDVGELLHRLAGEFGELPGRAGGAVQVAACDSRPLLCDPAHVEETLRNLISNALDAGGRNGSATLSYRNQPRKRRAVISVSDNGCGMDEETVKRIFEPYYTTKTGGANLGLGLYYSWNVMNAHGGSIRVTSTPGEGSTVSLLFPVRRSKRT